MGNGATEMCCTKEFGFYFAGSRELPKVRSCHVLESSLWQQKRVDVFWGVVMGYIFLKGGKEQLGIQL